MTAEEYRVRYRIASGRRGLFYDRAMLRSFVRRAFLVPEHRERALGYLDDDAWMRRRKGQTPSSIVSDIEREVYG